MSNKVKYLEISTLLISLIACSEPVNSEIADKEETTTPNLSEQKVAEVDAIKIPEYKILKDTVKSNIKRTVEVELPARTDEAELEALATEIHGLSNKDVERTFIGYRIAGEDKTQAYWATTHYNPNLEVKILGKSASDYSDVENAELPEEDLLGAWMVSRGMDYKLVAYTKDSNTYIQNIYGDGTSSNYIYKLSKSDRGTKLQDEDGEEMGEYFIINDEGDLEFWSDNGNYYTASKI